MGVAFAAERRLLNEAEYEPVVRSHYPTIGDLDRAALIDLAGGRRTPPPPASGIVRHPRPVGGGEAEGRSEASESASERGLAAKKQVFVRAPKRVNSRIETLDAAQRRAQAVAGLRAALARRQAMPTHHPAAGPTAGTGLRNKSSRARRTNFPPGRIGSVSQAGKTFQAARDSRGG